PLSTINSITEKIPVIMGKVTKIKDALELPELRWVKTSDDPKIKQMIEYASVLEGFARNTSLHAAGVVIAPGPISDYVPLYNTATQYTMKDLEDAGLLKMDFLGLATLSIIERTLEQVKNNHGIVIDIEAIDFTDQQTYSMISEGKTLAIFQFESPKMTEYLQALKPTTLDELVAMNALYRPGPMDNIPEFIDRKFGRKEITYLHPMMENILKMTNGIIVYQEQVMQLVQTLAGFTLAQADTMRRAMGKKDEKLMQEQREVFVKGAKETCSIESELATQIFDLIVKFASYGFNKSHSVAYAYLAYQTAWLKCHYPAEFLAANMTSELNNLDKITALIEEAGKFDITVLPPSINKSGITFTASDNKTIVFGMAGIKGVGIPAVESILATRERDGKFSSLFDFMARVDNRLVNKRALEALICTGAFDAIGNGHRAQLFESIDLALEYGKAQSVAKEPDMDSLFGDDVNTSIVEPRLPDLPEWSDAERLEREYQFLNFYVSGHPLQQYTLHISSFATLYLGKKDSPNIGKVVRAAGMLSGVRTRLDKREKTIAFATLEDFTGKSELIFWSDSYAAYAEHIHDGAKILVVGKSDLNDSGNIKITVDELIPLDSAIERYAKGYQLRMDVETSSEKLTALQSFVSTNGIKGVTVNFILTKSDAPYSAYQAKELKLPLSYSTAESLIKLFGKSNVRFLTES
ncbi:MAG: DNA polymerase III subunit alpha, partial [Candidatus Kapabacteria bacterium]|nr:DNA polymerase III subunit alpha [Candidatus Kapabacteria bacterium]